MNRTFKTYFDCSGLSVADLTAVAEQACFNQFSSNWHIGDAAIAAKAELGDDNWSQCFPEWASVDHIGRCEAVARAYKPEERNPLVSWSIHKDLANHPARLAKVAEHAENGRTSDEAREINKQERQQDAPREPLGGGDRWLMCIDVSYFLHRAWASGAGVEAAMTVSQWIQRTAERLRDNQGLSDVACCFDSKVNKRKELTEGWEKPYKDRPPKDDELVQQLRLVWSLLNGHGFCCAHVEGYEADDLMASYAKQFDGRVTLLSKDKDLFQCLEFERVDMLRDVEWADDEFGHVEPVYHWFTEKDDATLEGSTSLVSKHGLLASQWADYQCLWGDASDNITGAVGVGEKGARDLILKYGTPEGAIDAAKAGDTDIKPKAREGLIGLEETLDVTRQLVTLVTDLAVPANTAI